MSLFELRSKQKARIVEIQGGAGMKRKVENMGLRIGSIIVNLNANFLSGPLIIQNGSTQIAIGQGIAKKIMVEAQ